MGGEGGDGIGFSCLILLGCYTASHRKASDKAHRVKSLHGKIGEIPGRINSKMVGKHIRELIDDYALE
jgi:hypothetical protein